MSTYDIPNITPKVLHDCVCVNVLCVCVIKGFLVLTALEQQAQYFHHHKSYSARHFHNPLCALLYFYNAN